MAYGNRQMEKLIPGLRTNTAEGNLDTMFCGVTWDNIKDVYICNHEYGKTKFSDIVIVAYYFKYNFNLKQAGLAVGYSSKGQSAANGMYSRLRRINNNNLLNIARELIRANLITVTNLKKVLETPLMPAGLKRGCAHKGKAYKYYAKRIVTESLSKFEGDYNKAAKAFGVTTDVIAYWKKLVVEDIMIKPKEA